MNTARMPIEIGTARMEEIRKRGRAWKKWTERLKKNLS
jgi:hypothetical protein